jgi:hypothetical protein
LVQVQNAKPLRKLLGSDKLPPKKQFMSATAFEILGKKREGPFDLTDF